MSRDSGRDDRLTRAQRQALQTLFAGLPEPYGPRHEALMLLREEFHRWTAEAIQPSLRAHALAQPSSTLADRSVQKTMIDRDITDLGLGLADSDGHPVNLVLHHHEPTSHRLPSYRFVSRAEDGGVTTTYPLLDELPNLNLTPLETAPHFPPLQWKRPGATKPAKAR